MSWAVYAADDGSGSADWRVLVLAPLSFADSDSADSDSSNAISTAYICDSEEISTIYNAAKSVLGTDSSRIAVKCTGGVAAYPVIATTTGGTTTVSESGTYTMAQTAICSTAAIYDYSECTNLTEIPAGAFCGDTAVTSVALPETVTYISDKAFFGCSSLAKISAVRYSAATDTTTADSGEGNTESSEAEAGAESADSVTAESYTSVTLSVTGIGEGAFAGCAKLTDSIWNTLDAAQIETIGTSAFAGTQVTLDAEKLTGLADSADIEKAQIATATDAARTTGTESAADTETMTGEDSTADTEAATGEEITSESTTETTTKKKTVRRAAANTEAASEASEETTDEDEGVSAQSEKEPFKIADDGTVTITEGAEVEFSGFLSTYGSTNYYEQWKVYKNSAGERVLVFEKKDGSTLDYYALLQNMKFGWAVLTINVNKSGMTKDEANEELNNTTFAAIKFGDGLQMDAKLTKSGSNKCIKINNLKTKVIDLSDCTSLKGIAGYAFNGATSSVLEKVKLPTSITEIDANAFSGCTKLTTCNLSDCKELSYIGENAFKNCSNLTSCDLTGCDSLSSIEASTFSGCTSLTSCDLTGCDSLSSIGASAFSGCTSLTSCDLTGCDSLSSIGASAFSGCTNLITSNIFNCKSLSDMGNDAFKDCSSLKVNTDDVSGLFSIEGMHVTLLSNASVDVFTAFTGSTSSDVTALLEKIKGMESVSFADEVTSLPNGFFKNFTNLKEVDMTNSKITSMGTAFRESNPETVIIKDSQLTEIGTSAFQILGSNAKSIVIEGNSELTTIGNYAFQMNGAWDGDRYDTNKVNALDLSEIAIRDNSSLTSIGYEAFTGTHGLMQLDLSGNTSLTSIADDAMYNTGHISSEGYTEYRGSFTVNLSGCTSLAGLPADGICTVSWKAGALKEVNLSSSGITEIPKDYFNSDSDSTVGSNNHGSEQYACLTTVNLSDCKSLTTIGKKAFNNDTGLITLNLSGCTSLTTIEEKAFYNCTSLTSIDLSTDSSLTSLEANAFSGCTRVSEVKLNSDITPGTTPFQNVGAAVGGVTLTIGTGMTKVTKALLDGMYIDKVIFDGGTSGRMIYIEEGALKAAGSPLADLATGNYYVGADGCLYESEEMKTLYYVSPNAGPNYILPSSVETIKTFAFCEADKITTVTIPSGAGLKNVENAAFANCENLARIKQGDSVGTTVETAKSLLETVVGDGGTVGEWVFYGTAMDKGEYAMNGILTKEEISSTTAGLSVSVTLDSGKGFGESSAALTLTNTDNKNLMDDDKRALNFDKSAINENIQYLFTGSNNGDTSKDAGYTVVTGSAKGGTASSNGYARVYVRRSSDAVKVSLADTNAEAWSHYYIAGTDIEYFQRSISNTDTSPITIRLQCDSIYNREEYAQIWCQAVESETQAPMLTPGEEGNYQQVNWETARWLWKYNEGYTNTTNKHVITNAKDNKMQISLADGDTAYRLGGDFAFLSEGTSTANSDSDKEYQIGADPTERLSYSQTITLPDGIELSEGVKSGLESSKLQIDEVQNKIYVTLDDGTELLLVSLEVNDDVMLSYRGNSSATTDEDKNPAAESKSSANANIQNIKCTLTDDGKLQVTWDYVNPNAQSPEKYNNSNYGERHNIYQLKQKVTYNKDAFVITDEYDFKQHEISCSSTQTATALLSGNTDTDASTDTFDIQASAIEFGITKSASNTNPYMGADETFTLTVKNNSTVDNGNPETVTDTLPTGFAIKPLQIESMLQKDVTGRLLTVTIENLLSDLSMGKGNSARNTETVTSIGGSQVQITPERKAAVSDYKSGYVKVVPRLTITNGTDTYENECVVCTMTLSDGTEGVYYIGEGQAYTDLSSFFTAWGLMNTCTNNTIGSTNTTYTCTWTHDEDCPNIEVNETRDYTISAYVLDTFERLSQDQKNKTSAGAAKNTGKVTYLNKQKNKEYKTADVSVTPQTELILNKSYDIIGLTDGQNNYSYGDTVTYTLQVQKPGGPDESILPLHDEMTGSQALLVPQAANQALADKGLETKTVDGTEYYILAKAGTYEDVTVGTWGNAQAAIADRIVVTQNESSLTTHVYWYLDTVTAGTSGATYNMKYMAVIDSYFGRTNNTGDSSLSFGNKTYLNERDADQLYDEIEKQGPIRGFSKHVVTYTDEKSGEETLASSKRIQIGETVRYKLTFTNSNPKYQQTFKSVYDELPCTYGLFDWEKGQNVKIVSCTSTIGDTTKSRNIDWQLTNSNPSGGSSSNGQSYIVWNMMNPITVEAGETITIYVELMFPDDMSTWQSYANKLGSSDLVNTLHNDMGTAKVTHTLKMPGRPVLQKGVYGIYSRSADGNKMTDTGSRTIYSVPSGSTSYIYYYVVLYNEGTSNLYLNNLQDILPSGFEFGGMCTQSSADDINRCVIKNQCTTFTSDDMVSIADANSTDISYLSGSVSASTNESDPQQVTFTVTLGNKLTYLKQNEAIAFGYLVKAGAEELADGAQNQIAMQYCEHDPDDPTGFSIAENVVIQAATAYGVDSNDGTQETMDNAAALEKGFTESGVKKSDGTVVYTGASWLTSRTSVTEGGIVPGIDKSLIGYKRSGNDVALEGKIKKISAETQTGTIQKWQLTLYNEGKSAIDTYTVTDTIEAPFRFYGSSLYPVQIKSSDENNWLTLFYIYELLFPTNGNSSQVVVNGKSYNIVDDEWLKDLETSDGIKFSLMFHNNKTDGTYEMNIKFDSQSKVAVSASGSVSLYVYTKTDTAVSVAKDYTNTAVFQPEDNCQTVSQNHGTAVKNTAGKITGVKSADHFSVTGTHSSTCFIQVTDDSNELNYARSQSSVTSSMGDYIIIGKDQKDITYALTVVNTGTSPFDRTEVVCNLPRNGDTSATSSTSRESQYDVMLQGNQNAKTADEYMNGFINKVKVGITNDVTAESSNYTEIDSSLRNDMDKQSEDVTGGVYIGENPWYTILFSDGETDANGNKTWITYEELVETVKNAWEGAVASGMAGVEAANDVMKKYSWFKMVLTGKDIVSAANGAVTFTVPARLIGTPGPEQIAWCNFGYAYTDYDGNRAGQDDPYTANATSKNVGVKQMTVPTLTKTLSIASKKSGITAETLKISQKFIAYKSEKLSYSDEQDLYKQLNSRAIPFTVFELTSSQIAEGASVQMDGLKKWEVTGDETSGYTITQTDTDWDWAGNTYDSSSAGTKDDAISTGITYTIAEIDLPEHVYFQSVDDGTGTSTVNSVSILYKVGGSYVLNFKNIYDDYNLDISKLAYSGDGSEIMLADAGFARYQAIAVNNETEAKQRIYDSWFLTDTERTTVHSYDRINATATREDYLSYLGELFSLKASRYMLALPISLDDNSAGIEGTKLATTTAACTSPEALYNALVGMDTSGNIDNSMHAAQTLTGTDSTPENYFAYAYIDETDSGQMYVYILMDYKTTGDGEDSGVLGRIDYAGVTGDSYRFREIVAPSGYELQTQLIEIDRADSTRSRNGGIGTATVGGTDKTQTQTVVDNAMTELPMTGSTGTRSIYLLGLAMMLLATFAAAMMWGGSRRRLHAEGAAGAASGIRLDDDSGGAVSGIRLYDDSGGAVSGIRLYDDSGGMMSASGGTGDTEFCSYADSGGFGRRGKADDRGNMKTHEADDERGHGDG